MVEIQGHYIQASMVAMLSPATLHVGGRYDPACRLYLVSGESVLLRGTCREVALQLKTVTDWEKKS
jgi:hypothetical protein